MVFNNDTSIVIPPYVINVTVHTWAQQGQSAVRHKQHGRNRESALLLYQHVPQNSRNVDGSTISVWEYSCNFETSTCPY
jgi:hypothetical protein